MNPLPLFQLIVTGGSNDDNGIVLISNTGETLTSSDGWKKILPELPARTYFHCSVKVNETLDNIYSLMLNQSSLASCDILIWPG